MVNSSSESSNNSYNNSNTNNLRRRRGGGDATSTTTSPENNNANGDDGGAPTATVTGKSVINPTQSQQRQQQQQEQQQQPPFTTTAKIIWLLLHAAACGVYILGLVLQKDLHSSVECSMTYSQRQLIPIPMLPAAGISSDTDATINPKYGLYKFVDQRDPRPHHKVMLKDWREAVQETKGDDTADYRKATNTYLGKKKKEIMQQDGNKETMTDHHHCLTPTVDGTNTTATAADTVVVLFVPGHWGSYMQARSIGAHGIQLTGARDHRRTQEVVQALLASSDNNTTNSNSDHASWKGRSSTKLPEFIYDVYSIDFREQGGALHAQFLVDQTAFVAQAVHQLATSCQLSQILLVGHSIGGYVARLTPILHPTLVQPYVRNIVTLGSPHAHPVFGFESTLHQLHRKYLVVNNNIGGGGGGGEIITDAVDDNTILVAISGGLRDEMIPPVACDTSNTIPNSLSVLASTIMDLGPNGAKPQIGMDHKAIVWCNNLLSVVRGVVFELVQQDQQDQLRIIQQQPPLSPMQRLDTIEQHLGLKHDDNYAKALEEHQTTFRQISGFGSAIAMECAMLYHLELLVGLFVVLGCIKSGGIGSLLNTAIGDYWWASEAVLMMVTICLAMRTAYEIHLVALAILTFVANAALGLLQSVFGVIIPCLLFPQSTTDVSYQFYRIRFFALGLFLLLVGLQTIGKLFDWPTRLCLAFLFAIYIVTINSAIVVASTLANKGEQILFPAGNGHGEGYRLLAFTSTFVLVCPSSVAGKIMALLSTTTGAAGTPAEFLPSAGLQFLTIHLLLPIALRLVWLHYFRATAEAFLVGAVARDQHKPKPSDILRASLIGLAILHLGPSLFQIGQSYHAENLVAAISWIECLCVPLPLLIL